MGKKNRHERTLRLPALCGAALLACGSALGQEFDENGEPIAPVVISGPRPVITPQAGSREQPADHGEAVSFEAFSEPVELSTLVDYVGSTLGINIVVKGTLTGTVMFNAPVDVPKRDLLNLLDALLEQYDYTISQDRSGIYTVQPKANVPVSFGGERPTSKIIDTAGLRPTGLQNAIQTVLGQQAGPGQSLQNIAYIDELGVIVMTGPARNIARVEELIANLRGRYQESRFSRIELLHVAAPVARERLAQLVGTGTTSGTLGQATPRGAQGQQGQVPGQVGAGSSGSALDNIADRLTVDAQSNALIFRGNDSELAQVLDVMRVIDVPNSMQHKQYFAGSAVQQIADLARQRGLGEVITLQDTSSQNNQFGQVIRFPQQQQQGQFGQTSQQIVGGPIMVVDVRRQSIIYYGTESQQDELAKWIDLLDVGEDIITLEYYKLSNARAVDVATIIQGLITGQSQTGQSPLLPGGGQQFFPQFQQQQFAPQGEEAGFAPDPNRVFVIADEANNQVVVKAPKKQQNEFSKLVGRLDLRRPQVYLQVQIVAVSDQVDFRLAVESQLKAGQFQAQNLFGLSTTGTGGFQAPRTVAPNLPGFTSALIRSDMIPFIINAMRTDTDSRILSSPQLLVNDNEEASIAAIDLEPTTSTSQGDNTTITSFQGYERAGTELTVTPTISEAGYIRLEYEVILSNFTGQGTNGIPPPKAENTVTGIATIPSDASIVVGGIEVDNTLNTVVRVPLLGDIPLVGHLFRDTNKGRTKSLLYVFITPRILTDPNFQDLRLLTRGPQAKAGLDPLTPPLSPSRIEMVSQPAHGRGEQAKPEESEPIVDGGS